MLRCDSVIVVRLGWRRILNVALRSPAPGQDAIPPDKKSHKEDDDRQHKQY